MGATGRLLLHVGLPKTGSTAVQTYFAANRAGLAREGVHWSRAPRGGHAQLAACFAAELNRVAESIGVGNPAAQIRVGRRLGRRLAAELRAGHDVLVSSEHLSAMLPSRAEVAGLADFCHAIADRIEVVAVLRRGDHWLPSSYAEGVVGGTQRRFNAAFVEHRASLLDHVALVQRWTSGFGTDAVHVVPMIEEDKAHASALPSRILAAFGVKPDITQGWSVPADVVREGLSAYGTEVLRSITPLLPPTGLRPGHDRERLREYLAACFPGPAVGLTPSAAAELHRRGWVHTGVESLPQAYGEQWSEQWSQWRTEPDADVRDFDAIRPDEAAEVVAQLQREGIVRHRSSRIGPELRRAAIRLLRST